MYVEIKNEGTDDEYLEAKKDKKLFCCWISILLGEFGETTNVGIYQLVAVKKAVNKTEFVK